MVGGLVGTLDHVYFYLLDIKEGEFGEVQSYLCRSWGMGARGRLIQILGGWGAGGRPPAEFAIPPSHQLYITQMTRGVSSQQEYIMYTVSVQWEEKRVTHTAWTKAAALAWLACYPHRQVFGKVTDLFGRRVAVKYRR